MSPCRVESDEEKLGHPSPVSVTGAERTAERAGAAVGAGRPHSTHDALVRVARAPLLPACLDTAPGSFPDYRQDAVQLRSYKPNVSTRGEGHRGHGPWHSSHTVRAPRPPPATASGPRAHAGCSFLLAGPLGRVPRSTRAERLTQLTQERLTGRRTPRTWGRPLRPGSRAGPRQGTPEVSPQAAPRTAPPSGHTSIYNFPGAAFC